MIEFRACDWRKMDGQGMLSDYVGLPYYWSFKCVARGYVGSVWRWDRDGTRHLVRVDASQKDVRPRGWLERIANLLLGRAREFELRACEPFDGVVTVIR